MARSWSLVTTISPPALGQGVSGRALILGTDVIFVARGIFYKWNPSTGATAISTTTTFPNSAIGGLAPGVRDFCIFNGQLFCMVGYLSAGDKDYIYRYTGGTSWVLDGTLDDENPAFPDPHVGVAMPTATEGRYYWMDCDDTYMFVHARQAVTSGETLGRMLYRDTGGNYGTATMPGGGYDSPQPQLVGRSKGYSGNCLAVNRTGSSTYRAIQRGSPGFSNLSASDIGDRRLIGYADGYSFFSLADGGNWELRRSTDWGVTLSAAGNVESPGTGGRSGFIFKDLGGGVVMLAVNTTALNTVRKQIYTWDSATSAFVTDGTLENGLETAMTIYDFFVLNNTIYVISNSFTANSVDIWSGGSLSTLQFYYGIDSLALKSSVPLGSATQDTMAVRRDGTVAIGNANPNEDIRVVRGSSVDDWASWEDVSHDHGEAAVAALRWING